jgi:predicted RNase H-like HicB family nuclease
MRRSRHWPLASRIARGENRIHTISLNPSVVREPDYLRKDRRFAGRLLPYDDNIRDMKLTAVFEPAKEGGSTCLIEEIPAVISQGDTLAEAKTNLLDALKLLLECQRELVEKTLSPKAVREPIEFPDS